MNVSKVVFSKVLAWSSSEFHIYIFVLPKTRTPKIHSSPVLTIHSITHVIGF